MKQNHSLIAAASVFLTVAFRGSQDTFMDLCLEERTLGRILSPVSLILITFDSLTLCRLLTSTTLDHFVFGLTQPVSHA